MSRPGIGCGATRVSSRSSVACVAGDGRMSSYCRSVTPLASGVILICVLIRTADAAAVDGDGGMGARARGHKLDGQRTKRKRAVHIRESETETKQTVQWDRVVCSETVQKRSKRRQYGGIHALSKAGLTAG